MWVEVLNIEEKFKFVIANEERLITVLTHQ